MYIMCTTTAILIFLWEKFCGADVCQNSHLMNANFSFQMHSDVNVNAEQKH